MVEQKAIPDMNKKILLMILLVFFGCANTPLKNGPIMHDKKPKQEVLKDTVIFVGECIGGRATGKRHASLIYVFKVVKILKGNWNQAKHITFEVFSDFGGKDLKEVLAVNFSNETTIDLSGYDFFAVGPYFKCNNKHLIIEVVKETINQKTRFRFNKFSIKD